MSVDLWRVYLILWVDIASNWVLSIHGVALILRKLCIQCRLSYVRRISILIVLIWRYQRSMRSIIWEPLYIIILLLYWCFLNCRLDSIYSGNKPIRFIQLSLWSLIFVLFALIKIYSHFSFSLVKHEKLPPYWLLLQKSSHFKVHCKTSRVRTFPYLVLCIASACYLSPPLPIWWALNLLSSCHFFQFSLTWKFKWNKLIERVLYLFLKLGRLLDHLCHISNFLRWGG